MIAGLDLCQGRGLVILSKSPEHHMMGGQTNCLFIMGVLVHALETVTGEEYMPSRACSPTTYFKLFYN